MSTIDFRQLFEATTNPYMVLDRELRFVDANAAYLAMTGSQREALIGQKLFEVFPNDPADSNNVSARRVRESLEKVIRTRERDVIAHISYRVPRTPGGPPEDRVWSATHTPIFDASGEVELLLQHSQDVTALVDAERPQPLALAASVIERASQVQRELGSLEARVDNLRAMFDQAPGFVAFLEGPEHRFELTNRSYDRLIGRRNVIGRTVREALPELAGQGYYELLDRVFASGEPFIGESMRAELARPGATPTEVVYLDFLYQPVIGLDGTTRGIVVQGHDVTLQRDTAIRQRLMLRATEHAVSANDDVEAAMRGIADAAVEELADWAFVDLYDSDATRRVCVAHADPADAELATKLLAYPTRGGAARAEGPSEFADGVRLVAHLTPAVIEQTARSELHRELLAALNVRSLISARLWHGGRLLGLLGVGSKTRSYGAQDRATIQELGRIAAIALDHARLSRERRALLESEQAARERAESANAAKDEFIAMLGHELRNPLAPILTAVQLMRLRGDTSSQREQAIIERQANHLVRLLDDLLDVSRIARGKIELRKGPVEIAEVAAKAVEIASPLLEQKHHQLTITIQARGLRVLGDEARLSQVIANLLTNAARYTDPRGQISLSAARESDQIVIRVRDNGIGISPEMMPRIFELFVQAPQSAERSEGGLGLGLTLVRRLVEMHGGTVLASSAGLGSGSEMSVRLPALGAEVPEPIKPAGSHPVLGVSQRILVVDDNQDAALLLGDLLRRRGHEVHLAHDGLDAVRQVVELTPDVAIIDIGLPTIDGYEVARRVRKLLGSKSPRLIALTGYGAASDRENSRQAGFETHLTKPVESGRLLALIDRASAA